VVQEVVIFYWDLALVLNFIALLPWLWATARLAGHPIGWRRLLVTGLLGSVTATLWSWLEVGRNLPGALLGTVLLLQIAFGPLRVGPLLRTLILFLLIGSAAAGLAYMVYGRIDVPASVVMTCLSLVAGGAHVLWAEMVARATASVNRWRVRLEVGDRSLCLDGLVDTGHQLKSFLRGVPVLLVAPTELTPLLGDGLCRQLSGPASEWDHLPDRWRDRTHLIPFHTVAGQGILPAIRPDGVWLKRGADPWRRVEALVGIAVSGVGGRGDYQVLLPPLLLESLR
jgi:sigma-E processing peptidase SpoIIGA